MPDAVKVKINFEVSEETYIRILKVVAGRLANGEKANISTVSRDCLDIGLSAIEVSSEGGATETIATLSRVV